MERAVTHLNTLFSSPAVDVLMVEVTSHVGACQYNHAFSIRPRPPSPLLTGPSEAAVCCTLSQPLGRLHGTHVRSLHLPYKMGLDWLLVCCATRSQNWEPIGDETLTRKHIYVLCVCVCVLPG